MTCISAPFSRSGDKRPPLPTREQPTTGTSETVRVSDLIRDSKLETHFLPGETVHTFQESDSISGRRLVTRSEHWRRQRRIGGGGFGSVWLETRTKGGSPRLAQDVGTVRAVKQIDMDTRLGSIDYKLYDRELEAIAKFSHSRVSLRKSLHYEIY